MIGIGRWWSRLAAATVLTLLVGLAVALHRPAPPPSTGDGHSGHAAPVLVPVAVSTAAPLPRTGWTVTADDAQEPAADVLDGDPATSWLAAGGTPPHWIAIDTHNRVAVSGLTYLPPPTGRIGQYHVEVSNDGSTWSEPVATGTFADDQILKTVTISTVVTRYVRLTAVAGDAGAAEINLLGGTDPALPRTGWTATADSANSAYPAANALDGNTTTLWHTDWTASPVPALPHTFTIDMHTTNLVSGLSYLPRQDASANGTIGDYRIETSADGTTWAPAAATGTFTDGKPAQTVTFGSALARYVRLTALTEAGRRGPWSSAAEINLLGRADPTLSRAGWTVTSDSQATGSPPGNVLDGDPATIWQSMTGTRAKPLPHNLILDLHRKTSLGGLSYLPRPAAKADGRIGQYRIATSADGTTWTTRISDASFADSAALQTVVFPPVEARYVWLTVLTEAGHRGPWSSAAEINLLGPSGSVTPRRGSWGAPIGFPLVPVAAAMLPNGKILTWSSYKPDTYLGGGGQTVTATYDPATGVVTQRTVTETGHDMFCPGLSALADGRILVTGGNDSDKTSIYDPATDVWTAGPPMTTPRGYQAQATLADGRVFTIGGSWSGPRGGYEGNPHKAGEVWSAATGWTALPGADAAPMLTADRNPVGDYRKDNHAWLFAWRGGQILQAGPSKAMNWYTADSGGSVTPAGDRGDDTDAMNGNAVMYDAGKILTIGGSPNYDADDATANAHVLTISDDDRVSVRTVASMANTRAFANSVVLPDGKVVVIGGQNFAQPFSDNTAVLAAELWDPVSESFSTMATEAVPRVYHSVALLMPDGRVFSAGGGLCPTACATNHFDGQIFTPPYLLTASGAPAERPSITAAPATAANGDQITVRTDRKVTAFSIIRMGTATHSVDTDQRRISLTPVAADGSYSLTIPADPGIAVPGYWMLFALDAQGVPSVAKVIKIG
jgi:galactose oxidase